MEELFNSQPGLREIYNSKFLELSERAKLFGRNALTNEVIEIPVIVHVLEDGNPAYYKSDQDIMNWINRANAIFNGTANDILNASQGGAEIPVRLVLAKRTPTNQATNGIIRYDLSQNRAYVTNGVNYYRNLGVDEYQLTIDKQWDSSSYYNVYINNKFDGSDGYGGGLMGFAYYPGSSRDYSFMNTANLKSTDTTFAHEMMHAFGIKHVFDGGDSNGNTCGSVVNDGIDDTQRTKSLLSTWPVPTNYDFNECAEENYDGVQYNMMNYGYELDRFTPGQRNLAYETILALRGLMNTSLGGIPNSTISNILTPSSCTITGDNSYHYYYASKVEFGTVSHSEIAYSIYTDYTGKNNINSALYSIFNIGDTFELKVTSETNSVYRRRIAAYIDYNDNGQFEENEMVVVPTLVDGGVTSITLPITIPSGVVTNKALRFRIVTGLDSAYYGFSDVTYGACDYRKTGQIVDYSVIIKNPEDTCSTSSNNVIVYSNDSEVGIEGSAFEIKTYGLDDVSNLSLQWQKSFNEVDWIDIENANEKNATLLTEVGEESKETYYRLKIVCSNNSEFYSSTVKRISRKNYCEASTASTSYTKISNISFGNLNNSSASNAGYEDFTYIENLDLSLNSTNLFQLTLSDNQNTSLFEYLVWIDLNQNGVFEDSDKLARHQYSSNSGITSSVNITIPQSVRLGKTRMRVRLNAMYQQQANSTPCGISSFGQVEDYTVNITSGNETIWENGAWSNGIPTLEKEAIIKDNLVITTGELVAKKLTVESGSLTLNTGTILKLENELVNELTADKVIFENGAYLMQNNATALNVGNVTYKRNSTPIYRLETLMWSSPVDGQKIGELSPETLGNRFTQYDEPSNSWVAANINNDFQVGEMVSFRAPNTFNNYTSPAQPGRIFEGKFIGTPFNGEYSVPVTARNSSQGFNGIGNPFASPIDLDLFYFNTNNQAVGIDVLYFWTRDYKIVNGVYEGGSGSNWATYNAMGWNDVARTQSTINAAQGFIAKVRNQGTLKFDNSMRTVSQGNISFRNNTVSKYWLELLKEDRKVNSILIGNIAGSTKGYESNLDAKPMEASEGIFSLIDNDVFVIQARGEQIDENDRIVLKYSISERGEYKIKLTNPLGDFGTQNIYLVDHTLNEVINLSENELYTFTSEAGSFADRFEIIYNPRLLSTSELKDVNELVVYLDQKDLNIKSNEKFVGIQVYDLVGNLVKNISNIDETTYTIKLTNNTGVLIVNVKLANGKSVSKKIILK